jgi:hypothetical protein
MYDALNRNSDIELAAPSKQAQNTRLSARITTINVNFHALVTIMRLQSVTFPFFPPFPESPCRGMVFLLLFQSLKLEPVLKELSFFSGKRMDYFRKYLFHSVPIDSSEPL